jgi:hypothetical protein
MGSGKNNDKWASDENANDLLAGILDETEQDARSEQERIEAELEARDQERRRKEQEERERKRAEAKARITAEEERLEGLEKRRTMRQEALRIEELKERGEYVEPEPEESGPIAEQEPATAPRQVGAAARPTQHQEPLRETADIQTGPPTPTAPASSNKMPMLALAAVLALVAGAAITAFALTQGSYEPDSSTYTKSVYEPREPRDLQVSVGFTPIEQDDEEPIETPKARPSRPASPPAQARPATPDKAQEDEETEQEREPLILDEEGFDPFSEGF